MLFSQRRISNSVISKLARTLLCAPQQKCGGGQYEQYEYRPEYNWNYPVEYKVLFLVFWSFHILGVRRT